MADHLRRQIRDYLETNLAGLPTTAERVFSGRTRPLAKGHQPTLLIYARSEASRRVVMGRPPKAERVCRIRIEGRVVTPDPPDDLLDTIAIEVEQRMASLIAYGPPLYVLGGLAQNCELVSTEIISEPDTQSQIGGIALDYDVTYRVTEGAPDAAA